MGMELKVDLDVERLGKEIAKALLVELLPHLERNIREETVFSKKELAGYLGVSASWINDRIQRKEIPYIKMGKHVRFNKTQINKWRETYSVQLINTRQPKLKSIQLR
jgi:excisionase family DNA binding protein